MTVPGPKVFSQERTRHFERLRINSENTELTEKF